MVACNGTAMCGSKKCCMSAAPEFSPDACQSVVTRAQLNSIYCDDDCTGRYRICRSDADCDGPAKCLKLSVRTDQGDIQLGVCR